MALFETLGTTFFLEFFFRMEDVNPGDSPRVFFQIIFVYRSKKLSMASHVVDIEIKLVLLFEVLQPLLDFFLRPTLQIGFLLPPLLCIHLRICCLTPKSSLKTESFFSFSGSHNLLRLCLRLDCFSRVSIRLFYFFALHLRSQRSTL